MNYGKELVAAARKYDTARAALRQADSERDHWIRAAHTHGGMSLRDIASLVGVSFQRVGQIVKEVR